MRMEQPHEKQFLCRAEVMRRTGGKMKDGNWQSYGPRKIATIDGLDIQPASGNIRLASEQTTYASDHRGFLTEDGIVFEPGFEGISRGDLLVLENSQAFTIIFIASWGTHIELDLKEGVPDGG